MKKFVLLTVSVLIVVSFNSSAQEFQNGTSMINAGVGLGSSLGGFGYTSQTPALGVSYEYGMWDIGGPGVISLGGYLGYKSFKHSANSAYLGGMYTYSQKWTYLIIGARSAYHFNGLNVDKLDLYGGVMLSFNNLNYKYSSNNPYTEYTGGDYGSGLGLSLYVGSRYMFTNNIGAFLEAGYGISYLSIGAAFKL
ncbi:MAG: hypothetical protein LC117_06025 [Bacteroidia bacterium]|nr:hypothetical protein [Bacteroidia bacterium]MCZ2277468.1 hypothetical protein [Bacteroidia bacterium]